jgi:hypothetical protein
MTDGTPQSGSSAKGGFSITLAQEQLQTMVEDAVRTAIDRNQINHPTQDNDRHSQSRSSMEMGLLKRYTEASKKSEGLPKLTEKGNYINWAKRIKELLEYYGFKDCILNADPSDPSTDKEIDY